MLHTVKAASDTARQNSFQHNCQQVRTTIDNCLKFTILICFQEFAPTDHGGKFFLSAHTRPQTKAGSPTARRRAQSVKLYPDRCKPVQSCRERGRGKHGMF